MARRKLRAKKKKHRKNFTGEKLRNADIHCEGIRDDTRTKKEFVASNGYTYKLRKNGTYYPKHSSISVTQPTQEIYGILKDARKLRKKISFDELLSDPTQDIEGALKGSRLGEKINYDEFLIEIAVHLIYGKNTGIILSLSEHEIEELEKRIKIAKTHIKMMKKARLRASEKLRYFPKSTGLESVEKRHSKRRLKAVPRS